MKPCEECELLRIKVAMLAGEVKAWKAMADRAVAQTDEALASAERMAASINKYIDAREKCMREHIPSLEAGAQRPGLFGTKDN